MRAFEVSTGEEEPGEKLGPARIAFRILAGLIIAASFGVWGYRFSGFADREAPDLLADRELVAVAEEICAAAVVDVEAMPGALDAVDGPDRADQLRATTARYRTMVDDLAALEPTSIRDDEIYRGWLSDWGVLLDDRLRYADAIAVDPNAQFFVSDIGVTERLDRRVTRMANTNLMTSCAAPTDVG
ncbi:MAG: hypothetical protein AAF547_22675 [Actinomycetota bacterium]